MEYTEIYGRNMNLIQLRTERQMSQDDLARILGTTQATVSRYERGLRLPTPETAEKNKTLFDLTTDEMWTVLCHPKE